jgi:DNA-binding beta-propeller fold protein YncE
MALLVLALTGILACGRVGVVLAEAKTPSQGSSTSPRDSSPVDLLLTPDEKWLVTANQGTESVSLVEVASGKVASQVQVGRRPTALAMSHDGRRVFVTSTYSGELWVLELAEGKLQRKGEVFIGFEPTGVAISPDDKRAYVARCAVNDVVEVDLESLAITREIAVGRWPRYLAISPDGTRLAVGANGDRGVSVVDVAAGKMLYQEEFRGINLGQMQISADNQYVYFPWMVYRQNPITERNIQLGWVLGSRIARVRLDGPATRQAITLDPRGEAMSDPFGMGLTSDGQRMVCAASGTHELLVYRLPDCPFQGTGGPGDHIDPDLLRDRNRFYRIPLGGRPMFLRVSQDNRTVYVANYLENSVQVVDLDERRVVRTIELESAGEKSLARRGEEIFYDARRSLDQWYSCHSCHYEGAGNAVSMDTMNDGTIRTFKTAPHLYNVEHTGPWTWHGWQKDLHAAMKKSLKDTMLGPEPTDEDAEALVAFFESIDDPPNPFRQRDGSLTPAAKRGKQVFASAKANCAQCHSGPYFTDGQIHDVGLASSSDVYEGFNTPSLVGVHRRLKLLHHGRAQNLDELLTGQHNPDKVTGAGELTDAERADLIEYLKTL